MTRRVVVPAIALAITFSAGPAVCDRERTGTLSGSFAIGGPSAIDPSPNEPQDTHFRVHLTGEAAKALYDNMPVHAQTSVCTDGLSKTIGDMQCAIVDSEYECWFAIDIEAQTTKGDWAC